MLSKACIVGIYQPKLEAIARRGVELLALVPPSWRDERGETPLERSYTDGYRLETLPIRFNGNFHLHHYKGLGARLRAFTPDIVHIDEEPYNLATWQALRLAQQLGARALFFSWQNIKRRYPPPFSIGERWVLRNVQHAIVGTASAAEVWRGKGYAGPLSVIPQFGVDSQLFMPDGAPPPQRPFTIGYAGRLVEEKGINLLLEAVAQLSIADWRLHVLGGGPLRESLARQAEKLGIAPQISFSPQLPSAAMPAQYRLFDVLVLPSQTRPNWKEQFGRVLIEAMASGVPVIGSDSGAIPDVVGSAGLLFAEGDVAGLREQLERLQRDSELRARLRQQGLERVAGHYTNERIAAATVSVYERMLVREEGV